ncbi:MAG: hypothetical protein ABEJ72_01625, partial [Candidatus Aenigmatarchaeota archaeon]
MDYFKTSIFLLLIVFSFHTFAAQEEGSSVSVSIDYYCGTAMPNFYSPGNGTLAINSSGHFVADMYNSGNYYSNVTVYELNVTRQNKSFEEGDEMGKVVEEYDKANYTNLSVGEQFYYLKTFNATNSSLENVTELEGWYAGHVTVETSCNTSEANNESNSSTLYNFTRHTSFEVITAYGESGGVNTTGNQTTNKTFP